MLCDQPQWYLLVSNIRLIRSVVVLLRRRVATMRVVVVAMT
jgi:hypothetical protein